MEAKLNYFWRCLKDFHEAELTAPATTVVGGSVVSSDTIQPKQPPVSPAADLCRPPFTPLDLNELLIRLRVISPAGACLTNDLKGKAQGLRAAFTAAYRVLHWEGLLEPVSDKEWPVAFSQAYGAKLGKGAIAHKLTDRGNARDMAPLPFSEAVSLAREWVAEWKIRP